ncbi:MAG: transcriptional regulator [Phycisphaerae bacterium]|nr:transcriptional regulator [Phycisphaerae bacterium]
MRQWKLLRMLQTRGQGVALRELVAEAEVSERTIQRDLELLRELGFPLKHEEDGHGKRFWRMPHDFFRSGTLVLSLTEAVSLHLSERMFSTVAGTYLADGITSALQKIRSLLPAPALGHFADLDRIVAVRRRGYTDYAPYAGVIRSLIDAIREQRSVDLDYRAVWRDDEYTMRFDPYALVLYDGDVFVMGRSHRARGIRVLKVTRIPDARMSESRFTRPTGFSVEEHFRASFGIIHADGDPIEIVVRFSGPSAALVEERVWHESQQLARADAESTLFERTTGNKGDLLATFRLADVVEFLRWIKGFGSDAEVVRPQWLRERLRDELHQAWKRYD